MKIQKALVLLGGFLLVALFIQAQFISVDQKAELQEELQNYAKPPFFNADSSKVDSIYNALSWRERIGQLFMVAAYSNKGTAHVVEIKKLIKDYGIGGVIFFQGGPMRQAKLTNQYQKLAKTPLLVAMDAEWGLGMRLDSVISYPKQMALGAIQNNKLIYKMGQDIAEQCNRLGVHINFAPVVDVNSNPQNPVINYRSFGEQVAAVSQKSKAYANGMQSQKVMAVAKHFPGHGDTDADSHKELPVIKHAKTVLQERELIPFQEMISAGVGGIMIAHLFIPALDDTPKQASTLSKKIVSDLLKDSLGFNGLIFTDALNMKGVSKYFNSGELEVKALQAGNDVLLFPEDVPAAIQAIEEALKNGSLDSNRIEESCRKILETKVWAGLLNKQNTVDTKSLLSDLNQSNYVFTQRQLIENSLTLLKNEDSLIPFKKLQAKRFASVSIGLTKNNAFTKTLSRYANVTHYSISDSPTDAELTALFKELAAYDQVIAGIFNTSQSRYKKYGVTSAVANLTSGLTVLNKLSLVYFGNPYGLEYLPAVDNCKGLLVAYEDNPLTHEIAAQALFGGQKIKGKLPVTVSKAYAAGDGFETSDAIRFKFTAPEELNINPADLHKIDELALNGIAQQAYPGCQILVAKEGKVFYHKQFGNYTYEENDKVEEDAIYDLASITKIAASLLAFMKLEEQGKVNLDYSLCDYLPEYVDSTPYADIIIREMLAHQAKLPSWIPFYKRTMANGYPRFQYYSAYPSFAYPHQVAENMYIRQNFKDSIFADIVATPLRQKKEYLYSDLGYYFLKEIIEKQAGMRLDSFLMKEFYTPMGLSSTAYLPLQYFDANRIVPTEYDMTFRRQLVRGHVHDPGAAMLGGVGGHAGLFSNAIDLAKIMQLYLDGGVYGGERYLPETLIKEYTRCQYCESDNRRGAGFDKPVLDGEGGPTCNCISLQSFGHTGFTGTMAWADPDKEVVYIFLSNRVYPSAANKKLITMGIRTDIMEVIYDALSNAEQLANNSDL